MIIDPKDEVLYGLRLAREHLEAAIKRMGVGDLAGSVEASQLAAENSVKAVIAHFSTPSWSHDPSGELLEYVGSLPDELKHLVERLAEIVADLAPEHGRASYRIPERRITPSQIYDAEKAGRAVKLAEEALKLVEQVLKGLGYDD